MKASSTSLLKERLVTSVSQYVASIPDPPVPEDNAPGSSKSGVGALKSALTRSVRYNDKSTRNPSPKSA